MIAGFALFVIGFSVGPPRIFVETDLDTQLWIIDQHPSRWKLVMWVGGLQPLVTAIGFVLLSAALIGSQSPLLLLSGAGMFLSAGILVAKDIRANIADPISYLDRSRQSPATVGYVLLTAAAGLLYAIVLLQTELPSSLGYAVLVSAMLVPLLVIFKSSVAYAVIMAFCFVTFAVGLAILRL